MDKKEVKKKKGPRRPMNAFLIFCKRHRSKQREQNPDMDNRTITRVLGDMWAKLEPQEKSVFTDMAKENKEAFMRANPDYRWRASEKSAHGTSTSSKSPAGGQPSMSGKSSTQAAKENRTSPVASIAQTGGVNLLLMAGREVPGGDKKRPSSPASAASQRSLTTSSSSSHSPSSSAVCTATMPLSTENLIPRDRRRQAAPSPLLDGAGTEASSQEHTSALLQLAEMCTSELYSSVPPENSTGRSPTLQAHLSSSSSSSPLPPPKKRARQWSLDCSQQGAMGNEPPKSNAQRNVVKQGTGNRRGGESSSLSSGSKRQRNMPRNAQSASKASTEPSSAKTTSKSGRTRAGMPSWPPRVSQTDPQPPSPPGDKTFPSTEASGPVINETTQSAVLRVQQGQQLPGQPPPHLALSPTGPFSSLAHLKRLSPMPQVLASFDHRAWRDSSEKAIDFSRSFTERMMEHPSRSGFPLEKKGLVLPLPSEKGKIASLLSSSLPLVGCEADARNLGDSDSSTSMLSAIPPTTTTASDPSSTFEKTSPIVETSTLSESLARDCHWPSGVTQPFTEGKLKKKWTQRMMAQKEEDQARQIACVAEPAWSSRQDSSPPSSVFVQLEGSDCLKDPKLFASDNFPFNYGKTEVKSESPLMTSNGVESKLPVPAGHGSGQSLNMGNSSNYVKPEPFQSNTLYRALMGQAPSHLCLSSYASNSNSPAFNNSNSPAINNSFSANSENPTPKREEDKKVFTPIAACGKKIMDHIVERLYQTGFSAGDAKHPEPELDKARHEYRVSQMSDSSSSPPPMKCCVTGVLTKPSSSSFLSSVDPSTLVEKVVTEMCRPPTVQDTVCKPNIKNFKMEMQPVVGHGSMEPNWQPSQAQDVKKEEIDNSSFSSKVLANTRNDLQGEVVEDSNSADLPEDSAFQPVRKSRRANRGQKYQALIKEGIIQPSKERLAARNAERNVRSCSSREDFEKAEAKRVFKRLYSEREVPAVSVSAIANSQASGSGGSSPYGHAKIFDLEKEIASLPTCSFDQFEKKKMPLSRRHSEANLQKSSSKGSISQLAKTANHGSGNALKKDATLKNVNGKTTSCHASLKELGCHTVHMPLILEEHPAECVTGSRKRKARRHCITRISVAPPSQGNANSKSEKSSSPGGVVGEDKASSCHGHKKRSGTNGKIIVGKTESSGSYSASSQARQFSGVATATRTVEPMNDMANRSPQHVHQSFPALTLLSSVMIDSEKAVSPASQKETQSTTQSPTPAAKARPWPMGVEAGNPSVNSFSSPQFMPASYTSSISTASVPTENTRLAKWALKDQAPCQVQISHASSNSFPFPAETMQSMKLFPGVPSYSLVPPVSERGVLPSHLPPSTAFNEKPLTHSWPALLMSASYASTASHTSTASPTTTSSSSPSPSPCHASASHNSSPASNPSANPGKRLSTAIVPSPFVISTLPPSNTTSEATPSPWPKAATTGSSNKPASSRRKKPAKAAAGDEKRNLAADAMPSMDQKLLDPGTKKLVKLLLKGEGADELASRSGLEAKALGHPADPRQENPNLVHRPHPEQVQPKRRQASSKAAKGEGGGRGGGATSNSSQKTPTSPLYLSLKTQLEARQIFATDKYVEPAAKKHKPTIWDHLNSQSCLPISSARTPQVTSSAPPPAARKRGQEPVSPNRRLVSRVAKTSRPRGTADGNVVRKDTVGSDTESASEENEERVSSDTDSAEETEAVAPSRETVMINNNGKQSAAAASRLGNSKVSPSSGSNCCSKTPLGSPDIGINGQSALGSTVNAMAISRHLLIQPKSGGHLSSELQLAGVGTPSLSPSVSTHNYTSAGQLVLNQPPIISLAGIPKSPDGPRSSPHNPSTGQFVTATTSLPSNAVRPSSDVPLLSPSSLPRSVDVNSGSVPALHTSSPAVYLPVIVSTMSSAHNNRDAPNMTFNPAGCPISVTPHPPRIPLANVNPSSSSAVAAGGDPVKFDARSPTSLIEGGATGVSNSPRLPGSPSVTAVQS